MLALSAPLPSFAASDEIEEVVVTGSRIARDSNLTGAQPIQGVSSEDIAESGEFALMDVVNDIPALIGSLSQEMSIDSGFADGANLLNLRNLGINRTLTLVDGRRHVGGVQGSAAVDIGSIPKQLVERVEVLTGGASAVYGADAVTGVVNFILKDDFEGFEIDVNAAVSGEGDGRQSSIGAIWGKNFSDGRGNIVIAVDYSKDDGLRMSERPGATYGTGDDYQPCAALPKRQHQREHTQLSGLLQLRQHRVVPCRLADPNFARVHRQLQRGFPRCANHRR